MSTNQQRDITKSDYAKIEREGKLVDPLEACPGWHGLGRLYFEREIAKIEERLVDGTTKNYDVDVELRKVLIEGLSEIDRTFKRVKSFRNKVATDLLEDGA